MSKARVRAAWAVAAIFVVTWIALIFVGALPN